ncbi:hypothetical protein RvY_13587-4 [Ramazzottius varieornatus]|uniref:Uncharacterized protein n=1 Tax=Ramazzottius varieornatus TaxID=947166 RepID=A0A1D1VND6_RAMVA|nr:hypothetical protein RvY_13587-4 [Ramazzottius varieornatus]
MISWMDRRISIHSRIFSISPATPLQVLFLFSCYIPQHLPFPSSVRPVYQIGLWLVQNADEDVSKLSSRLRTSVTTAAEEQIVVPDSAGPSVSSRESMGIRSRSGRDANEGDITAGRVILAR